MERTAENTNIISLVRRSVAEGKAFFRMKKYNHKIPTQHFNESLN